VENKYNTFKMFPAPYGNSGGRIMKTAITILIFALLMGCATARERCIGYGYKPGSTEFFDCKRQEQQFSRQNALNTLNAWQDRQQRSHDSYMRNYGSAFKYPSSGNVLNCNTSPDFGTGTRSTCY